MKMKYIAAGVDLSFGNLGKGNADLLQDLSKGVYDIDIIEKLVIDGGETDITKYYPVTSSSMEAGILGGSANTDVEEE